MSARDRASAHGLSTHIEPNDEPLFVSCPSCFQQYEVEVRKDLFRRCGVAAGWIGEEVTSINIDRMVHVLRQAW